MSGEPTIVLSRIHDPMLAERVAELSDLLSFYGPDDLERDPALLGRAEIVYGFVTDEELERAERLRWLQILGAGVDGVITDRLRGHAPLLTNVSGIHAEPITEHMFGMALFHLRRFGPAWEQQKARRWDDHPFPEEVGLLAGRTLGVLGVGAIGAHSAAVGKAFGMRVVGLRRSGEPHPDVERMFTPGEKAPFFAEADVIMNSLPLTDDTRGFVDHAAFEAMPEGAILCNTGRGGTVDTDALLDALTSGRLAAALLDVTDPEPLPADHPLWSTENVLITPHYSGWHPGYLDRARRIFLDNLGRYTSGESLRNVVDLDLGY